MNWKMQKLNKTLMSAAIMLISTMASAQQTAEMADTMRSEGKIYVVMAIILTIVLGFVLYLFLLDRKIAGIEKQLGGGK